MGVSLPIDRHESGQEFDSLRCLRDAVILELDHLFLARWVLLGGVAEWVFSRRIVKN
jgi:hypothetical protein